MLELLAGSHSGACSVSAQRRGMERVSNAHQRCSQVDSYESASGLKSLGSDFKSSLEFLVENCSLIIGCRHYIVQKLNVLKICQVLRFQMMSLS